MFDESIYEEMKEGLSLFNSTNFWECHEALEDLWMEEASPLRNIYWAIIQVANALHHEREGNLVGANSQILKARDKIALCEKNKFNSNLMEEKLRWSTFKSLVLNLPSNASSKDFNDLKLFKFPGV